MGKTTVELFFKVQVIEWFSEVCPVQMRIDPEHLPKNHLADINKLVREPRPFAHIFRLARVRQLGQRSGRDGRVVRKGYTRGISRENFLVVYLAGDPSLHKGHIFVCWEFNRLSAAV